MGKREISNQGGSSLCWREEDCDASLIAAVEEMKHWVQARLDLTIKMRKINIITIIACEKQMLFSPFYANVTKGTVHAGDT